MVKGVRKGMRKAAEEEGRTVRVVKRNFSALHFILFLIVLLLITLFALNVLLPGVGIGGCIAVLSLDGTLTTTGGYGASSSGTFVQLLGKAEERPDVKGIMVEINSPGGSVVAAREIYTALKNTNKTTLAYISEVGASGGYFAAIGADAIFADPASLTGSIGARATVFDISRLLNNTGVNTTIIKSGEMKDIGDMFRPMSEEERAVLSGIVDEIFTDFKDTVVAERSENERFSEGGFAEILDARIITGKRAYGLGLIDGLGTRQEARAYIGERTGLGRKPTLCVIKPEANLLSTLFSAMGRGIGEAISSTFTRTHWNNMIS